MAQPAARTLRQSCQRVAIIAATALTPMAAALPLAAAAQQAVFPIVIEDAADPLMANLAIPANATTAGMWSGVIDWPIVAIHSTLLPDGRILNFGAARGGNVQDGRTLTFWNPGKGVGQDAFLTLPNAQNVDSFCSTATLLSDGQLLASGGASFASGLSSRESMVLDWKTSTAKRDYDLNAPRWYGTMTKLADGRVVVTGGGVPYADANPDRPAAGNDISSTPEIYTPGQGWRSLTGAYSTDAFGATNTRWWYPRQWVSPSGSVFGISTEKVWEMKTNGNGSIRTIRNFKTAANANTKPNVGPTSTAVMFAPGKILQVGGNGYANGYQTPSSAAATVFDITNIGGGQVGVTETAAMANPRQWANATVLPTGLVLVTGGTRYADEAANGNAVFPAEMWAPATGRWTTGASAQVYRGYHSTATLLPDGAVLVAGGGVPGPVDNLNAEIYYPPYLFTRPNTWTAPTLAKRPRLVSISANTANYGNTIDVQTATGDTVNEVSLIAVTSVTHSFNSNQRRMTLAFTRTANGVRATLPASANMAPPGYYLLSVTNSAGVPSRGTVIAIAAAAPGAPTGIVPVLPRTLVAGSSATFQPVTWPGYLVRHQDYLGYIAKIDVNSAAGAKSDASFIVRQGRGNADCYSFESTNLPGYFLQHEDFRLKLKADNSDAGQRASTFCARAPLNGSNDPDDVSLEAMDWAGYFLRHRNFEMWLIQNDNSAAATGDSTFHMTTAGMIAQTAVSLQPVTWPAYRVRHQNYKGLLSQIDAGSAPGDRMDASFVVRPGLANADCVSLEAKGIPGYFLRHQNFQVGLMQNDGSDAAARDSTFCPRPAANGSASMGTVSLEALSWPDYFLRHKDFQLYIMKDDGTDQAKTDTSFNVKPALD